MSVYSTLNLAVPVISYSIIHRARKKEHRGTYERTIAKMHAKVEEESAVADANYIRALEDHEKRDVQMLRGELSHFLETPIRSDNAELEKILNDTFAKNREYFTTGVSLGAFASTEGILRVKQSRDSLVRTLTGKGARYLRGLGYPVTRGLAPVYESVYLVNGGENLDVLEHIVRDRLGVYASPHGDHVQAVEDYSVATHNLLYSAGEPYVVASRRVRDEAVVYFSKPDVRYEEFRTALFPAVENLASRTGIVSVSVWQRKLGLGAGKEFIMRSLLSSDRRLESFGSALRSMSSSDILRKALIKEGCLVLKQLSYPVAS
jgi:hypothetical protein